LTKPEEELIEWFARIGEAQLGRDETSLLFTPAQHDATGPIEGDASSELFLGDGAMSSLFFVLASIGLSGREGALVIRGGTHTDERLSFEHLVNPLSWLLESIGARFELWLKEAGYASERGRVEVRSLASLPPASGLDLDPPAALRRVEVAAAASGLANHLHQRLASEAATSVRSLGAPVSVHLMKLRARQAGSVVSVRGWRGPMPIVSVAAGSQEAQPEALGRRAARKFVTLAAARDGFPVELMAHALVVLCALAGPSRVFVESTPAWWPALADSIGRFRPGVERVAVDGGFRLGFS